MNSSCSLTEETTQQVKMTQCSSSHKLHNAPLTIFFTLCKLSQASPYINTEVEVCIVYGNSGHRVEKSGPPLSKPKTCGCGQACGRVRW